MFKIQVLGDAETALKKHGKRYPSEYVACFQNLWKYAKAMDSDPNPIEVGLSCIHKEGKGLKAVTEFGGPGNPKKTRLYILVDFKNEVIHVLHIGGEKDQSKDI